MALTITADQTHFPNLFAPDSSFKYENNITSADTLMSQFLSPIYKKYLYVYYWGSQAALDTVAQLAGLNVLAAGAGANAATIRLYANINPYDAGRPRTHNDWRINNFVTTKFIDALDGLADYHYFIIHERARKRKHDSGVFLKVGHTPNNLVSHTSFPWMGEDTIAAHRLKANSMDKWFENLSSCFKIEKKLIKMSFVNILKVVHNISPPTLRKTFTRYGIVSSELVENLEELWGCKYQPNLKRNYNVVSAKHLGVVISEPANKRKRKRITRKKTY